MVENRASIATIPSTAIGLRHCPIGLYVSDSTGSATMRLYPALDVAIRIGGAMSVNVTLAKDHTKIKSNNTTKKHNQSFKMDLEYCGSFFATVFQAT